MTDLERAVRDVLPGVRDDLERLIRIPSVSAAGFDPAEVRRSAELTAEILERSGLQGVRLLEVEGAHPAVIGTAPPPEGAPTVLLYAHHDVQPQGDPELWTSPPFEPTERNGRLYGRGSADDKAGVMAHAAAVRAHGGKPPLGVTVFVEGEEETGSENLPEFLSRYSDLLASDAIVLADSSNWRIGQPALTTTLRGLVDCVVEVRTLDHGIHSGIYGGPFPDAITVLSRLLGTLHDDRGNVAIRGLVSEETDPLDLTEKEFREQAGALDSVEMTGTGNLTSRLWTRPSVSVLAIDAPSVREASNTLVPAARAKVSLRLAPGQDPDAAVQALTEHLQSKVEWGAEVQVDPGTAAHPFRVEDPRGPAHEAARRAFEEAWGAPPLDIGMGGSIPFVAAFAEAFPEAAVLITGVEDPDGRAHGSDESLHLGEFERVCVAETLLLSHLAPG